MPGWLIGEKQLSEPKNAQDHQCVYAALHRNVLTHWGRVTHICVGKSTIIASDNGLSPGWRQLIFWISLGLLFIGPMGTNFSDILIDISTFSFEKMHLKMSSEKWWPFCLGLHMLTSCNQLTVLFMQISRTRDIPKQGIFGGRWCININGHEHSCDMWTVAYLLAQVITSTWICGT